MFKYYQILHISVLEVWCCPLKLLQFSQDFWFTKNLGQISNFWQVLHWKPKHDIWMIYESLTNMSFQEKKVTDIFKNLV